MLAYLAIESGHAHRREKLAGLFWPERPERSARHDLRQALFDLRGAIGDRHASPPCLIITPQTLQINAESDYWLDVTEFTGLVDACETHDHRFLSACEACVGRLHGAVALYRGGFLEGFSLPDSAAFEEWALLERERLQRFVVDTLQRVAEWDERRGEHEEALGHIRRWVELEPWQEEAHRQLMRVLAQNGQRSAALAQYEACRSALAKELDTGLEEETTALYERIRDRAGPDVRSRTPSHNLPGQLTPFVGRETDLAAIKERLQDPGCRLRSWLDLGAVARRDWRCERQRAECPLHNLMISRTESSSSL